MPPPINAIEPSDDSDLEMVDIKMEEEEEHIKIEEVPVESIEPERSEPSNNPMIEEWQRRLEEARQDVEHQRRLLVAAEDRQNQLFQRMLRELAPQPSARPSIGGLGRGIRRRRRRSSSGEMSPRNSCADVEESPICPAVNMSATVTPERLSPREHDANNPNRSATPGVFSLSEPNTDGDDENEDDDENSIASNRLLALRVRNALPAAQAPQARHAPQKPAAPNVATAGHANGNNGDLTIEQVISNVVPPPGAYDGAPNHHQGFTRSLLSKIIGGSPQATWVKPASSKNYPYRLHPSHLYICVKRDLNQWLPKRPGEAGALTVFREDKAIAVHNRIYPLFICHDRNNWVYYGHYRFLHFPTNNGELPLARYNRFSQKQKEEWARHILSKSWGRKMLTKKKITTTEQEAIDVASLINFFESPDNQRHCRLMLRLMEPVRYDSTLYRQLLADSSPNADAGGPARRQRLQDSDEEGSH